MTLAEIVNDVKAHFERSRELMETHLPELIAHAEQVETNPVYAAAVRAAHIPDAAQAMVAELIDKLAAMFPVPPPVAADAGEATPADATAE